MLKNPAALSRFYSASSTSAHDSSRNDQAPQAHLVIGLPPRRSRSLELGKCCMLLLLPHHLSEQPHRQRFLHPNAKRTTHLLQPLSLRLLLQPPTRLLLLLRLPREVLFRFLVDNLSRVNSSLVSVVARKGKEDAQPARRGIGSRGRRRRECAHPRRRESRTYSLRRSSNGHDT